MDHGRFPSGGELRKSGRLPEEGEKTGHSKEREQCVKYVGEDGPVWDCKSIKYDQSLEMRVEWEVGVERNEAEK